MEIERTDNYSRLHNLETNDCNPAYDPEFESAFTDALDTWVDENGKSENKCKPVKCPNCKRLLSVHEAVNEALPHMPAKDDVTVCIYCAAILLFTSPHTLRAADKKLLKQLRKEKSPIIELQAFIEAEISAG